MVLEDTKTKGIVTGIPEIDQLLGGGLPTGALTLIEGSAEAGKSVLSQRFTYPTLTSRTGVAYYTEGNNIKNLLVQMSSMDLDVTDYFLCDRLRLYSLPSVERADCQVALDALLDHIGRLPDDVKLVVLDSLSELANYSDEDTLVEFFAACQQICSSHGRTLLAVVRSEALDDAKRARLRSLCDTCLALGQTKVGERTVRVLEVVRLRNNDQTEGNTIGFDVEPGQGIKTVSLSRARA